MWAGKKAKEEGRCVWERGREKRRERDRKKTTEVLVWSTGISSGSTIPPYITTSTKPPQPPIQHKIECLWCHHLERSRESCSTAELSFKRLHSASRWAPARCQCPMKWLVTAAWDTLREGFKNLRTVSIWHACMNTAAYRQIFLCEVNAHTCCSCYKVEVVHWATWKWFWLLYYGEWLVLEVFVDEDDASDSGKFPPTRCHSIIKKKDKHLL